MIFNVYVQLSKGFLYFIFIVLFGNCAICRINVYFKVLKFALQKVHHTHNASHLTFWQFHRIRYCPDAIDSYNKGH